MNYVYSYSVSSIVFLAITMYFYFSNARIHNFEDKFFSYLMCSSMVALVFDLLATHGDQFYGLFPTWALYLFNIIAISSLHFCQPCFCLYLYKANDERKFIKKGAYFFTFLPFMILVFLLLVSTVSEYGIFYIDEAGHYIRGAAYNVVFCTSAIYYVTAFVLVMVYYRDIDKNRNRLIIICFVLFLAAAALQYFFPRYLLNTSATALAVAILHLTLQNPVDRIDPFTDCFSRPQLAMLLGRYYEKELSYTLILFSVSISNELHNSGITESTARLLRSVSEFLRASFPNDAVVYMDSMEFTVVCCRTVDPKELRLVRESFASEFGISVHTAPPELNVAVLHSDEKAGVDSILMTLDYLFKRLRSERQDSILVADGAFRRECFEDTMLTANIEKLLSRESCDLRLHEMYNSTGSIAGYAANLSVTLEGVGEVCGDRLLQKADELGLGWKYFFLLLEKLSEERDKFTDGCTAEIAIPTSICLTKDAPEKIDFMVTQVGLKPSQLVFSMKEKSAINSHETVRDNIRNTAARGYTLRVTDFASGVTNVALFISMPVSEIELNVGISTAALVGGNQNKMLKAVIGLLKGLNKKVICSGVSDRHQAETLFEYGADIIEYQA